MKKGLFVISVLLGLFVAFVTHAESQIKRGGIVTVTSSKQGLLIKNFNN